MPNSLLWKISGNGLQKTSYLYGTIHLTDQRLFNFGDSLYNAIEKSEGFAIEVNPDDMVPYLVDLVKKQLKENLLIKEMMSDKAYKKYSTALSKKLKKPADEITTRDIFREKNKWVSESYRKGKMQTFMDAYLFDIARRQGKWMGGVEDMADQAGLADELIDESDIRQIAVSDEEESKGGLEIMMQAYLSNNLNAIDSISSFSDSASLDKLLVKRNKKMAWRMDSLGHVRSMVFAVGAAHLPGQQGLIRLLRQRGFSVEPVFFSKRIKQESYKLQEMDIPWVSVADPNGYYKVQMPGKPGDIEMYGLLTMKMYFNIFNGTGYLVTSAATPYGQKGIDSVTAGFAENLFHDKQLKTAKNITINGISGKELEKKDEEGYKRGFILYKNNIIYMAVGFSTKTDDAGPVQEVKKFLDSFKPLENETAARAPVYTYTDSVLAYQIDFPSKPQQGNDIANKTDKTVYSSMLISVDQKTGSYYFAGINQAASGYSITNDSTTFANLRENLKAKFSKVAHDTQYIKNEHWVLEYDGIMQKANLNAKMYAVFRGNRWYTLMAMYDPARPNPYVDSFLQSFKFIDFKTLSWKMQFSPDSLVSTWSPSPIQFNGPEDSTGYTSSAYRMFDTTHSDSYVIYPAAFGKYYWQNSDSALWNSIVKSSLSYKDTLLYKKEIRNNNQKGIEVLKKERGSLNATRFRSFLFGDSLYSISTTQQQAGILNSNTDRFFEDFRFCRAVPLTHLYTSKAVLLLNDLLLEDSASRKKANDAMNTAPFTVVDLPLLHQAILKKYPQTEYEYSNTNETIAKKITGLKDSTSLIFARKNYPLTTDKKIKNILLEIIAGYMTNENYRVMADLMLQSPPADETSWKFTNLLTDTGKLTAGILPSLLPLLKDTIMSPVIIEIAASLIDSSLIPFSVLADQQTAILAFAEHRYKSIKANRDSYSSGDKALVQLLGRYNSKGANAVLQKLFAASKGYLQIHCAEALIENGQPLSSQTLLGIAADKFYRLDLYASLKTRSKINLFPRQYLTQQYFAQSMVENAATDEEDEDPASVTLLSQKTILFKGKNARFFFYKIALGGEEETVYRLACAGPFSMDAAKMCADDAYGALYYEDVFDSQHLQKQMVALVKSMEDRAK